MFRGFDAFCWTRVALRICHAQRKIPREIKKCKSASTIGAVVKIWLGLVFFVIGVAMTSMAIKRFLLSHGDHREPDQAADLYVMLSLGILCVVCGGISALLGWAELRRARRERISGGAMDALDRLLFPLGHVLPHDQFRPLRILPSHVAAHSGAPISTEWVSAFQRRR